MSASGIPLDKAALLSVLLEALLYGKTLKTNREEKDIERRSEQGFSLLMFGGTIWTLLSQRSTRPVNRKMFIVACLLLLISTVVRTSFRFRLSIGQRLISCGNTAPCNQYHKGRVWFDIVPRHLPWRSCCVLFGHIAMDIQCEELRV